MFGLFGKKPTIHKAEAETIALSLSSTIADISSLEFLNNSEHMVRKECKMMGVFEELKEQEYREICQLAIRFKSGDKSRTTVDNTLKSF